MPDFLSKFAQKQSPDPSYSEESESNNFHPNQTDSKAQTLNPIIPNISSMRNRKLSVSIPKGSEERYETTTSKIQKTVGRVQFQSFEKSHDISSAVKTSRTTVEEVTK